MSGAWGIRLVSRETLNNPKDTAPTAMYKREQHKEMRRRRMRLRKLRGRH